MKRMLFFSVFILIFSSAFGYEVDQFTRRDEIPQDSTAVLDQEVQERLAAAVKKANGGFLHFKCNGDFESRKESRLAIVSQIIDQLTTSKPIGVIEKFADKNPKIKKRVIPFQDSIYKDAKKYSKILNTAETTSVITLNGVQIGIDKLGHFFDQGFLGYRETFTSSNEKQKYLGGLTQSRRMEEDDYGSLTTGVFSYGDISANYDGQRFWEKLCGRENNDTSESDKQNIKKFGCKKDAYLQCDPNTGDWVLNPHQQFTFKDFVTPAWDESINCSLYSEDAKEFVSNEMNKRAFYYKGNVHQPCPAEPQKCIQFQKNYPSFVTEKLTSPVCLKIIAANNKKVKIDPQEKFKYGIEDYKEKASATESKTKKAGIRR